ncbi:mycofactocin precursor [Mycolicibacterium iranicum]|uniref:Mycofactocin n=2 Tax=Mycolicibacterium iranicum TaxID=912594 RepID=A0A178LPY6_MYCIR|nr:mycofactocin precursor [Mycolicibacterium iranicum]ORV90609.1 mycofactocin [Mycolicibacterium iranicum]
MVSDLRHKCRDPTGVQPTERRVHMDQNQQVETEELVTESLVEEVSIDGMCGVY